MTSTNFSHSEEQTFRAYNSAQGAHYAGARLDYSPLLYNTILEHHSSTGGQFTLFFDIGTGPGNGARALAPRFTHAIGLDPSQGMIDTARSMGGKSASGESIRFEVSSAEVLGQDLSPPVADASVDLVTAANAAHWFDMPAFWAAASRVLKPGGTVALWTSGRPRIHPSTPNAEAIQAAVDHHNDAYLQEHMARGNLLTRGKYVDLVLPWTVKSPSPEQETLLAAFDEGAFYRKEWGVDDELSDVRELDLDRMERVIHSGSPQTRYDEAHPEDVGTERDPVRVLRRKVEGLLHGAGMTEEKKIKVAGHGILLVVKKR